MTTLLAFPAPPSDTDFTGGAFIFGNDFSASVAGTITGVWYYHTSSNEGANIGVQVHLVTGQVLQTSQMEATSGFTDDAWNLITLSSPVAYPTPGELMCLSAFYPNGMGFSFTDGLSDTTVGDLTCVRTTARFRNSGPPVLGDFPTGNDTTVGFAVGIEFVASGAGHAKGAEFLSFF